MSEKRPAVMPQAVSEIGQLTTELQQARQEIADLKAKLMEWEEREASVCPEDYSFEEVIATRDARIEELEKATYFDQSGKPIGWFTNHYASQPGTGKIIGVGVIGMGEDPRGDFESPPLIEVRDEDGNEWCLKIEHLFGSREAARSTQDGKGGV